MAQGMAQVWYDEAGYIRDPVATVRAMLADMFPPRRPSIRALKLTGASWHPGRIG